MARSQIGKREAELLADVEAQLSACYRVDAPIWADVTARATQAVKDADARVAEICRDLGVPDRFRPTLDVYWTGRGENAMAGRRAELRQTARTKIAAASKTAKADIEARESEVLVELLASGLTSDAAQRFLRSIPMPEQLMEPMQLTEIEAATPRSSRHYWSRE